MQWQPAALSLAGRFKKRSRLVCGPEARTRQTAGLFGDNAQVEDALRDGDFGTWKGQAIAQLDSHALSDWMTNSTSAPHGGESVEQICVRVADWMKSLETSPGR